MHRHSECLEAAAARGLLQRMVSARTVHMHVCEGGVGMDALAGRGAECGCMCC